MFVLEVRLRNKYNMNKGVVRDRSGAVSPHSPVRVERRVVVGGVARLVRAVRLVAPQRVGAALRVRRRRRRGRALGEALAQPAPATEES